MPKPVVGAVQASLGLMDPDIIDDNIYKWNLWQDRDGNDEVAWDINDEFKDLQKIAYRTELYSLENISESS